MGPAPLPDDPRGLQVVHGTCRTVLLTGRWAVKFPWGLGRQPVRGWLANRSEWRQRYRANVCRPSLSLAHVALIMPRAERSAREGELSFCREDETDEQKSSSWGYFGDRWLLVDFDRSWETHDRGLIGRLYWGNQERLARKWMKLGSK